MKRIDTRENLYLLQESHASAVFYCQILYSNTWGGKKTFKPTAINDVTKTIFVKLEQYLSIRLGSK